MPTTNIIDSAHLTLSFLPAILSPLDRIDPKFQASVFPVILPVWQPSSIRDFLPCQKSDNFDLFCDILCIQTSAVSPRTTADSAGNVDRLWPYLLLFHELRYPQMDGFFCSNPSLSSCGLQTDLLSVKRYLKMVHFLRFS